VPGLESLSPERNMCGLDRVSVVVLLVGKRGSLFSSGPKSICHPAGVGWYLILACLSYFFVLLFQIRKVFFFFSFGALMSLSSPPGGGRRVSAFY